MMTIELENTPVHPAMLEQRQEVRQPGGTAVCRLVWHTGSQTFKGNSALSSWFHLAAASAPYPAIFADFKKFARIFSDVVEKCRNTKFLDFNSIFIMIIPEIYSIFD